MISNVHDLERRLIIVQSLLQRALALARISQRGETEWDELRAITKEADKYLWRKTVK